MWYWNRTTGLWPPSSHILLYLLNAHLLEEELSLLGDNFQPQLPYYKASESDHFCLRFLQEPGTSVSPPLTARDPLSGRTGYNKDGGMSPLCPVNGPPTNQRWLCADPELGASAQNSSKSSVTQRRDDLVHFFLCQLQRARCWRELYFGLYSGSKSSIREYNSRAAANQCHL